MGRMARSAIRRSFYLCAMTFHKIHQYNFPTTIRFGAGASKELGDYLLKNNLTNALVVTDPTVSQLPFFKSIVGNLRQKKGFR